MRFDGSVSENLEGTFCQKMADSIAILVQFFSILVLDQFSQCRKMRLELAHLKKLKPRLNNFSSEVSE